MVAGDEQSDTSFREESLSGQALSERFGTRAPAALVRRVRRGRRPPEGVARPKAVALTLHSIRSTRFANSAECREERGDGALRARIDGLVEGCQRAVAPDSRRLPPVDDRERVAGRTPPSRPTSSRPVPSRIGSGSGLRFRPGLQPTCMAHCELSGRVEGDGHSDGSSEADEASPPPHPLHRPTWWHCSFAKEGHDRSSAGEATLNREISPARATAAPTAGR